MFHLVLLMSSIVAPMSIALVSLLASQGSYGAQSSPEGALAVYREVLRNRVKTADLGIYSAETRTWLATRRVTDAQQRAELAALEAAWPSQHVRSDGRSLAIVCFPGRAESPPYFMRRNESGWVIDLSVMARIVGFDPSNRWFIRAPGSEYAFGLNGCGAAGTP
jgi:hypothetical protein